MALSFDQIKFQYETMMEEYGCTTTILDVFMKKHPDNRDYVYFKLQCGLCSKIWDTSRSNFLGVIKRKSHGCIQCKNKETNNARWKSESLSKVRKIEESLYVKFIKGKVYEFTCKECKQVFNEQMNNMFLYLDENKILCKYCRDEAKQPSLERYNKYKLYEDTTLISQVKKGRWIVECNHCKYVYEAWMSNLIGHKINSNTNNCPRCSGKNLIGSSKEEKGVGKFLNSLGVKVESRKRFNKIEVDLFLLDYNIGIEYNGSFWHSIDNPINRNKTCDDHKKKTLLLKNELHLITIFSFQWIRKQKIIKSKISNLLGFNKQVNLRSSDSTVVTISWLTAKAFLETNHLMGGGEPTNHCYGIFDKTASLVGVATFKPRRTGGGRSNDEITFELNRYATTHRCYNGLFKIITLFKSNNPNVKQLISYADLCWTNLNKNIYLDHGFKFVGITDPNYWWCKDERVITRYQAQKHKLEALLGSSNFDPNKTEVHNMISNRWYRVFDCGHAKYMLDI